MKVTQGLTKAILVTFMPGACAFPPPSRPSVEASHDPREWPSGFNRPA